MNRPSPPSTTVDRRSRFRLRHASLLAIAAGLLAVNLYGLSYYTLPMSERVRDAQHALLKPTGTVGQTAGVVGFLMFLFLYLYPLRKRLRSLAFLGAIGRWLDVHIVVGLAVPVVVAVHAGWRFEGLIGLGYLAMFLVSLSGIVGKYLYTSIPRGKTGLALTLSQIERERTGLIQRIATATGFDPEEIERDLSVHAGAEAPSGIGTTLVRLVTSDFARFRATAALRRKWSRGSSGQPVPRSAVKEAVRLARREIAITQRVRMLDATQRVFRFWHVAHRPFSITAFVVVGIHVGVAVALGVTWFW
jgi:hypothetical protein